MCFSSEVSLIVFTINVLCSAYLLYNGITYKNKQDIFFSVLVILIGLIQFIEYILWENPSCNLVNHYATLSIPIILYLQPVLGFMVYFKLFSKKITPMLSFLLKLFTFIAIDLLIILNQSNLCSKSSSESSRLKWGLFNNSTLLKNVLIFSFGLLWNLLFILLFTDCFFTGLVHKNPGRYIIGPITFIIAIIYVIYQKKLYNYNKNFNDKNIQKIIINSVEMFGTMWCFLAVTVGITAVLHI
jgi:hypothetical protein